MSNLHVKLSFADLVKQSTPEDFHDCDQLILKKEIAKNLLVLESMLFPKNKYGKDIDYSKLDTKILRNKDFIRRVFTKYPTSTVELNGIVHDSLLNDFDFIVEIYNLTKCTYILSPINDLDLLFRLLKVDIKFLLYANYMVFNIIIHHILGNVSRLILN